MLNNPKRVKVEETYYDINTDFRVALECNKIAQDDKISDYERAMAIIFKLFGKEGLKNPEHYNRLIELGLKFLALGKEPEDIKTDRYEKPDFDFEEDYDYIVASFMYDYQIDLNTTQLHYWTFWNLLNGLSNSEFGNCCILNRIRNLRNMDTSQIKNAKERQKIEELKQQFALKKNKVELTDKQKASRDKFLNALGIRKEA